MLTAFVTEEFMAKSSNRLNGKSAAAGLATIHDQNLSRGEGGELHQIAQDDVPVLTTAQGGPVSDDQNSLKIGPRGPTVLEDFHFREKLFVSYCANCSGDSHSFNSSRPRVSLSQYP
jgi:hypothetical protein